MEEEKTASGEPIVPAGMERPQDMAVEVPEGTGPPKGFSPTGETNPKNQEDAVTGE
ncbi:MAG: hypothetical protein M3164_01450 [Actinomycetota bacterium]|nr:hypothetical protein [Actinomycetota bacterium]